MFTLQPAVICKCWQLIEILAKVLNKANILFVTIVLVLSLSSGLISDVTAIGYEIKISIDNFKKE